MAKYIIEFSKTGTICYTSHLDLMRIFKRAFKRARIPLAYSKGFNPHPKMGFAQPLSLGYWSMSEYIEFETADGSGYLPNEIMARLSEALPEGIDLIRCLPADDLTKTLAAHSVAAEYMIEIPLQEQDEGLLSGGTADPRRLWHAYMDQPEIFAWKRQKKKKDLKRIDIRPMIREITFQKNGDILYVDAVLDSGSASNLSPELVIASLADCFCMKYDRNCVSVMRKQLFFDRPLEELLRA